MNAGQMVTKAGLDAIRAMAARLRCSRDDVIAMEREFMGVSQALEKARAFRDEAEREYAQLVDELKALGVAESDIIKSSQPW